MTSPFRLKSGPPELPGLIAASVCRKISPSKLRFRVLTIPCETLRSRPRGLPTAKTPSPALQVFQVTQDDVAEFQVFLGRELQQGEVDERIQGHDLDVLDPPPCQAVRHVLIEDRRDPGLPFDHVVVRHGVPVAVEDEARPLARRRLDRDDRLAVGLDQLLDRRRLQGPGGEEPGRVGVDRARGRRRRCGRLPRLPPAHDLIPGNPEDVEADIDEEGLRLLGDDLAGDLMAFLELDDLGRPPSLPRRDEQRPESRPDHRHNPSPHPMIPSRKAEVRSLSPASSGPIVRPCHEDSTLRRPGGPTWAMPPDAIMAAPRATEGQFAEIRDIRLTAHDLCC